MYKKCPTTTTTTREGELTKERVQISPSHERPFESDKSFCFLTSQIHNSQRTKADPPLMSDLMSKSAFNEL